jgi:glyoxylase-like metal-dependent hydrolase (beta-lactamase superfamily II)
MLATAKISKTTDNSILVPLHLAVQPRRPRLHAKLTSFLVAASLAGTAAFAQDAGKIVRSASMALGADQLNTIEYAGSATTVPFGQTSNASGPWRANPIVRYTRAIDLTQPASRATGSVTSSSLFVGGTPIPGPYNERVTPVDRSWARQLELWITPWGFLKGAATRGATVRTARTNGETYKIVSWSPPQRSRSGAAYTVNGYINDQNLIERVETWVDDDLLGDLRVEASYAEYRDFGGVKVPTRIIEKRLGWPTFTATITSARANPPEVAAFILDGPGPIVFPSIPSAASEKIADGLFRLPGGYVTLAVEMNEYVVLLEGGGGSPARAREVIAETHRLIPSKPIRYVMSTHPHSDHVAGLAPYVAAGVTIITHENNRSFLEAALSYPRRLVGDELAKSGRKPAFLTISGKRSFTDGPHPLEIYALEGVHHSDGFLVAYLPKEKILFQGDFSIPPDGADPTRPGSGNQASEFLFSLADNLDRLNLWDFNRLITVHLPTPDVPWTRTDLLKAVGRPTESQLQADNLH